MKKCLFLTLTLLLFGCSGKEKTDKELLNLDQKALKESINTEKVIAYKFCKIMLRANNDPDSTSTYSKGFRKELLSNVKRFQKLQNKQSLSVVEYISMFNDYTKMRSYIIRTDEDVFQTLIEASGYSKKLGKKDKLIQESGEHALLSGLVMLSSQLGTDVALYECSETDPGILPESELKSQLMFFRGLIFFQKGFYYLSESEITKNIEWLEKNPKIKLPLTKKVFEWNKLNDEQVHTGFLAMNYLFRGFDRTMMSRKIDDERSLEDFTAFTEKMKKLGVSNELTLSVEAYIHLKKGENDKAILALEQLKKSKNLSQAEKDVITESIDYLKKNKDHSGVIDDLFDSVFIGKLAVGYTYSKITSQNWKSSLPKKPYSVFIQTTMSTINTVSGKLEQLESGETLKETAKEVEKEGSNLLDKAKGLFD